jgi:hypothetical protein
VRFASSLTLLRSQKAVEVVGTEVGVVAGMAAVVGMAVGVVAGTGAASAGSMVLLPMVAVVMAGVAMH